MFYWKRKRKKVSHLILRQSVWSDRDGTASSHMCICRRDHFCGCALKLLFSCFCYSFLKSRCTFSDKQYNQYICESICWGDFPCSSCAYLFLWRQDTCFYGDKLRMWPVWIPPPLDLPHSVFTGWSSVCGTVCIQTMVWLLFSVRLHPTLLQWHMKDPGHFAKMQEAGYTQACIHLDSEKLERDD